MNDAGGDALDDASKLRTEAARHKRTERMQRIDEDEVLEKLKFQNEWTKPIEIGYMAYVEPEDQDNMSQCRAADEENKKRRTYNQQYVKRITMLLSRMNLGNKWKMPNPPEYETQARQRWEAKVKQKDFKNLVAVEWLAKLKPPRYPVRDYSIYEAGKLADDIATEQFFENIRSQVSKGNMIDVTEYMPANHAQRCTCRCVWDGISETCKGSRPIRIAWRVDPRNHHFLKPDIRPEIVG